MNMEVWIAPHERREALEAYADWLAPDQVERINDAPEEAPIVLRRRIDVTTVHVLEEEQP